jgi:regulator of extracellular matrix RemA (YlzA/DUF370 family)
MSFQLVKESIEQKIIIIDSAEPNIIILILIEPETVTQEWKTKKPFLKNKSTSLQTMKYDIN